MDWLWKFVVVVLFAPFVIGLAAQAFVVAVATIFPYILLVAVTIGVVAGATAGLVLRHRLPLRSRDSEDREFPIPPPEAVRRPRGPRRRED